MYFGFDPGKDKCGIAIVTLEGNPIRHEVIASDSAIATLQSWMQTHSINSLILGDQTGSKQWRSRIIEALPNIQIITIDERFSSQQARDRYWKMYPAQGLQKLVPLGMRTPPRPIDDIVAIILVERYLASLD
ncbi:MAG: Holliday junction resolvase RuvX [Cyanobacteria bacterium]|jgi:RNase H-fold protein (predicted Holliday junction resolvase)|nr:Holliday junction resolvase RuvX [Cyanobacteriota bacterium]